jgi:hypothetical protein
MSRTDEQKWNLLTGQDSYAGQNAQDPRTSRKIQSWIPADDGQLHRELPEPVYAPTQLPGPAVGIYEFDQNNGQGAINRFYFAAARVNTTVGTKNCYFYELVSGAWSRVTAVGTLADAPMCVTQENNFFVADGVSNYLFNGTIWVKTGINFPLNQPAISVNAGSPQVYFSSEGVTCYFFTGTGPNSGAGIFGLNYPTLTTSATATATKSLAAGCSLLFNPPQLTGSADPQVQPMQWATLSTTGAITGYTTPWAATNPGQGNSSGGASSGYFMCVCCQLVIPAAGLYTITMNHDDGAFFGFGTGLVNGFTPAMTSGNLLANQTQMAMSIPGQNVITAMGGTNANGYFQETFTVNFPQADTYPLEIDYAQWVNQQTLVFQISSQAGGGPTSNPNPLPATGSGLGEITASLGKYYWFDNADQTNGVATESSSSPIGVITGPVTAASVNVYQQPGLFSCSSTGTTVTCSNSTDSPGPVSPDLNGTMVGQVLYINGTLVGTIASVGGADNTTLSLSAVSAPSSGDATYTGTITGGANNGLAGTIQSITGFVNSANNLTDAVVLSSTATTVVFANSGSIAESNVAASMTSSGAELNLTQVSNPVQVTLASGAVQEQATYTGTITGGANNGLAGTIQSITGFTNASNNITNAVVVSSTSTTVIFVNANSVAETNAAIMTSPSNQLTLTANALATISGGRAVICDGRCTHWNVYASESDGSKIGQYLFSVPVTQNLSTTPYTDTSPFLDSPSNTYLPVFRPVRNDPPFGSKILTVHKVRQFRRQETSPNFFAFTANEEVTAGNNGDPAQCLPGANINTVSDMVNVVSFPDQSARIRSLVSHMDALYMFSEKATYPLYGQSVDDFAISDMVSFALGGAGRFAGKSTPNGLVFMSYDRRFFLYPTSLYSTYLAQGGAAQSALTEIGKPMRNVFKQIPATRLDEVTVTHYHFGIRDWAVVSFPTSAVADAPQTWVWDFQGKGWFQLQRGFCFTEVLEVSEGALVLIGGDASGNTWVIDDQTGTYSPSGNLPASTWQPALIDFGNPEVAHVFRRLELEFDSAQLAQSVQITVWLDPLNVDSPGTGRKIALKPALGANRYAGFLIDQGGAVCQRMLLQVYAPANTLSGVIRGIKLIADTAPGFITGANRSGGV